MNQNISWNFQICISVPVSVKVNVKALKLTLKLQKKLFFLPIVTITDSYFHL